MAWVQSGEKKKNGNPTGTPEPMTPLPIKRRKKDYGGEVGTRSGGKKGEPRALQNHRLPVLKRNKRLPASKAQNNEHGAEKWKKIKGGGESIRKKTGRWEKRGISEGEIPICKKVQSQKV